MRKTIAALVGAAGWLCLNAAEPAIAQTTTQKSIDQADLKRDQADLKARQQDEAWEKKKNGGCGARCINDQEIEKEDKDRIKDDKQRIKDDD